MAATGKKKVLEFDPEKSLAGQLKGPDFMRLFMGYFGFRRAVQLMGIAAMWDYLEMVPDVENFRMEEFVRRLEEGGFSSRTATYNAAKDLRDFVRDVEKYREGYTLKELLGEILRNRQSLYKDTVVQ